VILGGVTCGGSMHGGAILRIAPGGGAMVVCGHPWLQVDAVD
jgi:hypothetical protein